MVPISVIADFAYYALLTTTLVSVLLFRRAFWRDPVLRRSARLVPALALPLRVSLLRQLPVPRPARAIDDPRERSAHRRRLAATQERFERRPRARRRAESPAELPGPVCRDLTPRTGTCSSLRRMTDRETSSDVLVAPMVIEYPFSRTTGPVIGAFLTGLRERVLVGIKADRRTGDRAADRVRPDDRRGPERAGRGRARRRGHDLGLGEHAASQASARPARSRGR